MNSVYLQNLWEFGLYTMSLQYGGISNSASQTCDSEHCNSHCCNWSLYPNSEAQLKTLQTSVRWSL